ncbi:hypothetical protein HMPREF1862_01364 [Varibaculum cambriense]|uniref:Uncharacterized protein n=1 Tax=Varibaculum cambriense TaxID=184870 RepID=A0AB34WYR9_9ACTO|nr:hypothetical protein HMPREF1862_01364 [Varibaculum cambriense]
MSASEDGGTLVATGFRAARCFLTQSALAEQRLIKATQQGYMTLSRIDASFWPHL